MDDADGILVVRTRRGDVRVRRDSVTAVKEVPPSPSRRGRPHRALSVEDLQRVIVGAWPAMETARLGDWVLRASRGFTQRANSVMTAGSPGIPVPAALDAVERWYAERGLPPNLTVAGPVGFDPADDAVGAEALRRGYLTRVPTLTLTAPTRPACEVPTGDGSPRGPRGRVPREKIRGDAAGRRVVRGLPRVPAGGRRGGPRHPHRLAGAGVRDRARQKGPVVGIGRLGLAAAWGGIAAMWVDPRARRRGTATRMLVALARAADRAGAASLHLQVDTDNTSALGLYERHGFERHHAYVNLSRPQSPPPA